MPQYCCVPGCKKKKGGHLFPRDNASRQRWRVAIRRIDPITKRLWNPGPKDRVCSDHFADTDFKTTLSGSYKKLKSGVVPSRFHFKNKLSSKEFSRAARVSRRHAADVEINEEQCPVTNCPEPIIEVTVELETIAQDAPAMQAAFIEDSATVDTATQCTLLNGSDGWSVKHFVNNPQAIKYYTGFDDYDHFRFFLAVLGPAAEHLDYRCNVLTVEDHLFMTLMKLRQAKDDAELAILFNLSAKTVGRVIQVWINFMYYQLKELNIWPSQEIVHQHMPKRFGRLFSNTRVILDATECVIEKPSHVALQSSTFSSYKNRNTVKTVVGCTPHGAVSFISDTYGGSTTDRQIIERSTLCSGAMFDSGDSIMADRGIMVQDLFASKNVFVNTPHMLRGKSQLEPADVVYDRRVASKRIHVERVIGLAKTFKILEKKMSVKKIQYAGKIIFICFAMTNFRNCIVGSYA